MSRLVIILLVLLLITSIVSVLLYVRLNVVLEENKLMNLRYNELLEKYASVRYQLANLSERYMAVSADLENALIENKRLNEWLRGNISKYSQEVETLKTELNITLSKYDKLLIDYDLLINSLKSNMSYINELEFQLQEYASELERLNKMLRKAVIPTQLPYENHTLNKEFLNRSVKSLEQVSRVLPDFSGMSVEEVITKVILWISNNTYYQYDLDVMRDYWKLPNETIMERGGDCEDLAVLGYALLKWAGLKDVYLLSWYAGDVGHVGVLTYVNGNWFLIDPGWTFVNGYELYLTTTIRDAKGALWTLRIHPSHLNPLVKELLLSNNLAKYEWYDCRAKRFENSPDLERQASLKDFLLEWSRSEGHEPGVWTLITDENTFIVSNVDEVVNTLSMLVQQP